MIPRLRTKYNDEIRPSLPEKVGRKNILALPKMEKIVINMGVGEDVQEKKHIDDAVE